MSEQKKSMEWKKELDAVAELSDEVQMQVIAKILDEMDEYDEEEHLAILEELNVVSERIENRKQGQAGKIVLNQDSASNLKAGGIIAAIIGIGFSIWLGVSRSSVLDILPFAIIAICGMWLFGKGKFCQLIITPDELSYSTSFFGMEKIFMIADLSKITYSEDGKKIKIYKDDKKVIAMKVDIGEEREIEIPYFSEKGVEVEDQRPKIDSFKVRENISRLFLGLAIIGLGVFYIIAAYKKNNYWSTEALIVSIPIFLICLFFGMKKIIHWKGSYLNVMANEIYYKKPFTEEKRFSFSYITGYSFVKGNIEGSWIELYHGEEKIATIPIYNYHLDLFVAKMNKMGIPRICEKGEDRIESLNFSEEVRRMERKIEYGKGYLFRE